MMGRKYSWSLVLWGAGEMTRRVLQHIGIESVSAIVDSDKNKVGERYLDIPIISLSEYLEKHFHEFILVTPMYWREIVNKLKADKISRFFLLADCPSEFSEISARDILHDRICHEMPRIGDFYIYGSTLYALILNEWAKECLNKYVPIILPDGLSKPFTDGLRESFSDMIFYDESYLADGSMDTVIVSDGWDIHALRLRWSDIHFIDAFDISDREKRYYSPKMAALKNTHEGETCFVVGLGPSLSTKDLDMLEQCNIISFSMNTITKAFAKTNWRPTYYVMSDPRESSDDFLARLEEIPREYAFISDKVEVIRNSHGTKKTVSFHELCNMPSKGGAFFSEDAAYYLGYGATVTYSCLQIAAYMGFKRIYMLGLDGYDPHAKNHGYGHFYEESSIVSFAYIDQVYRGYESARKYGEDHGIQILNATRGGYIEIFDRVDFDDLFSEGRFTPERAVIRER